MISAILGLLLLAQSGSDRAEAAWVLYSGEVAEILAARCVGCHHAGDPQSGLSLESVDEMLRGGKRGPAIVPGQAGASRLVRFASGLDEPAMPPREKPEFQPLSDRELGRIRLWIDQGARDDSAGSPANPRMPELGELPDSIRSIFALDLTPNGRLAALGRGNRVEVVDLAAQRIVARLAGHRDLVQSVRFSPDGRWLAAGSFGIVTVHTCPSVTELGTLNGHSSALTAMAVSGDGTRLATAGDDRTLKLWMLNGVRTSRSIPLTALVHALSFSQDGATLAVGDDEGAVRLYDTVSGRFVASCSRGPKAVAALAVLPDGRVVSASDGLAWIEHMPRAGTPETRSSIALQHPESMPIRRLVAVPERDMLLTVGDAPILSVWDLATGAHLRDVKLPEPENDEASTPAMARDSIGARVAVSGSHGHVYVCDLDDFCVRMLPVSDLRAAALAFSKDGTQIAVAKRAGRVCVLEARSGRLLHWYVPPFAMGGDSESEAIAAVVPFEQDGFASVSQRGVNLWNVEGSWSNWKTLEPHADRVLALDFHPAGGLLAAASGAPTRSGQLTFWEIGRGLMVRRIEGAHSDAIYSVRFSPDGMRVATGSADKLVKTFDITSGRELRVMEGHNHHVLGVDWNAAGTQVVSASADGVLKFWDPNAGEVLRSSEPVDTQLTGASWLQGTRTSVVITSSADRQVRVWNPANTQITRVLDGPDEYLHAIAGTPDRARVIAGGEDGVLWVWDGVRGRLLGKMPPDGAWEEP